MDIIELTTGIDDLRARSGTVYHPSCTARMGPDPASSVVDARSAALNGLSRTMSLAMRRRLRSQFLQRKATPSRQLPRRMCLVAPISLGSS